MSPWTIYDRIEEGLALAALSGVVLSVLIAAIGRSLGEPVTAAPQYAQLALIWSCMLGADVAARNAYHIRVDALFEALPRTGKAILSALFLALILPFLVFVAWHGWFLATTNWERELGASGLSYGLVTLALPVGAVLLAISFVRRIVGTGLAEVFDPGARIAGDDETLTEPKPGEEVL